MRYLILALLTFFSSLTASDSYKVVGYFENWAQWREGKGKAYPHQMDPSKVTHICYAFGYFNFKGPGISGPGQHIVTGDWKVYPVEWTDLNEVVDPSKGTAVAPSLYNQTTGYDPEGLKKFDMKSLKERNPDLKVLLSIGGWNFCDPNDTVYAGAYTYKFFSEMVANPDHRAAFISSACEYLIKYNFDGLDLDWEYPASSLHGGTSDDYQNYLTFLKELRDHIQGSNLSILVTIAAPPFVPSGTLSGSYQNSSGATFTVDPNDPATYFAWQKACMEYLDWINVMCYDYYGAWPGQKETLPNAPTKEQDSLMSVSQTIKHYLDADIDPLKFILGIPSYGRTYSGVDFSTENFGPGNTFTGAGNPGEYTKTPGYLAYYEVMDQINETKTLTEGFDDISETPYAYNQSEKAWASFDNKASIQAKMTLVKENHLGGAMMWALDNDEFYNGFPLLTTINQELEE